MTQHAPPPARTAPLRALLVRGSRLRSGWRLIAYAGLLFMALILSQLPLIPFAGPGAQVIAPLVGVLGLALYLAAVVLATWIARRFVDRRSFISLGFERPRGWVAEMLFGAALGAVLMLGIFAAEAAAGWTRVTGFVWQERGTTAVALGLGLAVWQYAVVAVNEELIARGYLLQNLEEGLNLPLAVVISSVIFGLLHLANPDSSWISTANLAVAGLLLAAGYVVTRRLWMSIGLHFAWNLFEGTVLGFPVSGGGPPGFSVVRQAWTGPLLVTGGNFGPEAGLTGLAAMLAGTALILAWMRVVRAPGRQREPGDVA